MPVSRGARGAGRGATAASGPGRRQRSRACIHGRAHRATTPWRAHKWQGGGNGGATRPCPRSLPPAAPLFLSPFCFLPLPGCSSSPVRVRTCTMGLRALMTGLAAAAGAATGVAAGAAAVAPCCSPGGCWLGPVQRRRGRGGLAALGDKDGARGGGGGAQAPLARRTHLPLPRRVRVAPPSPRLPLRLPPRHPGPASPPPPCCCWGAGAAPPRAAGALPPGGAWATWCYCCPPARAGCRVQPAEGAGGGRGLEQEAFSQARLHFPRCFTSALTPPASLRPCTERQAGRRCAAQLTNTPPRPSLRACTPCRHDEAQHCPARQAASASGRGAGTKVAGGAGAVSAQRLLGAASLLLLLLLGGGVVGARGVWGRRRAIGGTRRRTMPTPAPQAAAARGSQAGAPPSQAHLSRGRARADLL